LVRGTLLRPRSPWLRRNSILLQKNSSSNMRAVPLSTAGFRSIHREVWSDGGVKYLALSTFRPCAEAHIRGAFRQQEMASCKNLCKKKILHKR